MFAHLVASQPRLMLNRRKLFLAALAACLLFSLASSRRVPASSSTSSLPLSSTHSRSTPHKISSSSSPLPSASFPLRASAAAANLSRSDLAARLRQLRKLPRHVRVAAYVSGFDLLTLMGNYVGTLAAPLLSHTGNFSQGTVSLVVFATLAPPGTDYQVLIISQYVTKDPHPPDSGAIFNSTAADPSTPLIDLSYLQYRDITPYVNGAVISLLTVFPFLTGVFPSTDVERYLGTSMWSHTKDVSVPGGTLSDYVTAMLQAPYEYAAQLGYGGSHVGGSFAFQ